MDGTHIGGSFHLLPEKFKELNCTTAQIFMHNPRAYKRRGELSEQDIEGITYLTEGGSPLIAHATFPCTITNPSDDVRTIDALDGIKQQVENARRVGIRHLVLHPGRIQDEQDIQRGALSLQMLEPVLQENEVELLLENSANGMHGDPSVLARMIEIAGGDWVGLCFDTAHGYAFGIDTSDEESMRFWIPENIWDLIGVVHFNNSMYQLNSRRDRHGKLSEGVMSMEQLEEQTRIMRTIAPYAPFIIESTTDPSEVEKLRGWSSKYLA